MSIFYACKIFHLKQNKGSFFPLINSFVNIAQPGQLQNNHRKYYKVQWFNFLTLCLLYKNVLKNPSYMKKEMNITASLYDPGLLKNLVEKLATRHVDFGYNEALVPENWKALETFCTMAYVMGTFSLQTKGSGMEQINMPFTSCFLFTCTKEKYGLFNLEWSSSLS